MTDRHCHSWTLLVPDQRGADSPDDPHSDAHARVRAERAVHSPHGERPKSIFALALLMIPAVAMLWIIARLVLSGNNNGSSSSSSTAGLSFSSSNEALPFEAASANWTLCKAKPPHRHHAGWSRPASLFPRVVPPSSSPPTLFVQQTWEDDALFLTCPPGPQRWRIRIHKLEVGNLCGMRDVQPSGGDDQAEGMQEAVGPPFQVTPVPGSEVGESAEIAAHRRVLEERGVMFLLWPCQRDLTALLRSACEGKQLCCVNHATVLKDDPCHGVLKLAVAQWTCEKVEDADAAVTKTGQTQQAQSLQQQEISEEDTRWHTDMGTLDTLNPIAGMDLPATSNSAAAAPLVPAAPSTTLPPRTCVFSASLSEGPKQGIGLWNQLQTLTYSLALAHETHCNISVDAFLPDFDSLAGVPLSMVLDLQATRRHMQVEFGATDSDHKQHAAQQPPRFNDAGDDDAASTSSSSSATAVASSSAFIPTLFDTPDLGYSTQWSRPYGSRCFSLSQLVESSYVLSNRTLFESYASLLRSHPDPGTLWMTQMWGSWVQRGAHAHIDAIKYRMFVCMQFTPPFLRAALTMQRALGLAPRSYIAVHFRFEDDMARFLASKSTEASKATAASQLEAAWERFCVQFEHSLGADRIAQPQDVYLATGLRSAHPYVQRLRQRYPHMRIHTKDVLLADYCASAVATAAPAPSSLVFEFLAALAALPWVGSGLGSPRASCRWLSGELPHPPNREYWAVLDYLLASEARVFVGATLKPDSAFTKGVRAKIEHNNRGVSAKQDRQEVHVFY